MDYGDEKKQEMLPQMLAYNEKPVSPSVLSQRYYVTPNNGNTFTSTSSTGPIIRIDIPGSTPGTHLNPSERPPAPLNKSTYCPTTGKVRAI